MQIPRRRFLQLAGLAGGALFAGQVGPALASAATAATAGPATTTTNPWQQRLRGMTCACEVGDQDIADFAATGGDVLRVHFCDMPMLSRTAPYALNSAAFTRLDEILASARKYGVRIIVDPHVVPGMASTDTCYPTDELWQSSQFQDLAVGLWSYIAQRYLDSGDVIAAYDLLNEPAVPDVSVNTGLASWNALALRMAGAVRQYDSAQYIIIEPAVGPNPGDYWHNRFDSIQYLPPPPDGRTIISPHMYAPDSFTFQGVEGSPTGFTYPSTVDGTYWDKTQLATYMTPARDYQQKYQVPILIGEFSAARWTGSAGVQYLQDNISVYEQWGWSWTYHAWREYQGWDAEMSSNPDDFTRYSSTPRLDMLERNFALNAAAVVATFGSTTDGLSVAVDGSASSAPGGDTIASFDWGWGDGSAHGSGTTAGHTYAAAGTFPITLTVTDNQGKTGTSQETVTIAHTAPSAVFTWTAKGLGLSVDASGSSAADGATIASYGWDWGDGSPQGSGPTGSHAYAGAGTFTVALTVTDSLGATAATSQQVSVTSTTTAAIASDGFDRTVTGGWGSADLGGSWSRDTWPASYAVAGGTGQIIMRQAASGPSIFLNEVAASSTDLRVSITTDRPPTGGGVYVSLVGRHTSSGDYNATVRLAADGTAELSLVRVDSSGGEVGLSQTVEVPGLGVTAGTVLDARVSVAGTSPTQLQAKLWKHGTAEPADWQLGATDSASGWQTAGSVGLMSYLSSSASNAPVTCEFGAFSVTRA